MKAKLMTFILIKMFVSIPVIVKANHTVFQLKRKPWVLPVATEQESVITAIKGCPSGALKYKLKNSDEIEP